VDYAVVDSTSGTPQVLAGNVRALLYSGEGRSRFLTEIPASAELGIAEYLAYNWVAAAASAHTSREVVEKIRQHFQALSENAGIRKHYENQAATVIVSSPEKMFSYQQEEIERWRSLMKKVGIPPQ